MRCLSFLQHRVIIKRYEHWIHTSHGPGSGEYGTLPTELLTECHHDSNVVECFV